MDSKLMWYAAAFVLYLAAMVFIGLRNSFRTNNAADFFLGARSSGPWTTALSAEASDMSGWLLMGLPGVAYLGGMKEAFWTALGLVVGTYLNWLFVAKRLRKYTIHAGDSITIPEFFTNRFKDKSRVLSLVSVIFILIFFTIYTASGFVACAKLFHSVFGMSYLAGLALGVAVILVYTLLGGYLAVVSTDFVQGTLMFIALVVTTIIGMVNLGGASEAVAKIGADFLNPFHNNPDAPFGAMAIVSALAWGLGYFGMPHILVRFMGLRSNKEVAISRRIAIVWVIIAFIGALLVGAGGRAYLATPLAPGAQETVFIAMLTQMFPAFIAGIFLCGILAAAMSTADSQLLVAASAFSKDIYLGFLNKKATEKQTLLMSRVTLFVVAAIAFVIALDPSSSIFGLVSYAWAGFGATFGPLILLSLFWKGITRNGALTGLISGGVVVIAWKQIALHGGAGIFKLYEIVPGFVMCLAAAVIVSLLDRPNNPDVEAEYEAYEKLGD